MEPSSFLSSKLLREHRRLINDLKRRRISGAFAVAIATVEHIKRVVGSTKWRHVSEILKFVKIIGRELVRAQPIELSAGNCVRRVLHCIREEYREKVQQIQAGTASISSFSSSSSSSSSLSSNNANNANNANGEVNNTEEGSVLASARAAAASLRQMSPSPVLSGDASSLRQTTTTLDQRISDSAEGEFGSVEIPGMKTSLCGQGGAIDEIIEELKDRIQPITQLAANHIHNNEVIMTCGYSATLREFFKKPGESLSFQVFVAESAPSFAGHRMAKDLAQARIEATVVTDSAVFALMARVNKVIVPCHAVMANGGIVARAGTAAICTAAKFHRVPVVCVGGLYKLSPLYPHDEDALNDLLSPSEIMSFKDISSTADVEVINNAFDYIEPDLIDLFITNVPVVSTQSGGGGFGTSSIYRLIAEYYSMEDTVL
jgi:translation initiation factor eIF-2B subunit beta